MIRWFLIACGCLSITACSSVADQTTSLPAVAPTIVAPADPPDILAFTDGVEPLNVASWDVEDVQAHVLSIRSRPHTIRSMGPVDDTIEVVDGDVRISTAGTNAVDAAPLGDFTIRVSNGREWVRYGHVRAATFARQQFAAAAAGFDIDELLADADLVDQPIVERFATERAFFAETSVLDTMWVPYERNDDSIFLASPLDHGAIGELLDVALAAIVEPRIELTTDALVIPLDASSDFAAMTIPLDRSPILLSATNGWSLTLEPGVTNIDTIGAPHANDILNRNVLLAFTQVQDSCITAAVEATALVESGIVTCDGIEISDSNSTLGADE